MMKRFILFLFSIGCFTLHSLAQKTVSELTISYKISIESADGEPSLAHSLEGATFVVFIKGNDTRTDMTSSLGTESNFYNTKTGKGYILKEYSGQKLMITLSKENWAQKNQMFQNLKFTVENGEQTVAGFLSKKAAATLESGRPFIVYFTSDILPSNKEYNNAFKYLPGIPALYELESGKLKFKYTLTNISYDNVPGSKFEVPKTGYRVMTYDENQQMKKGVK